MMMKSPFIGTCWRDRNERLDQEYGFPLWLTVVGLKGAMIPFSYGRFIWVNINSTMIHEAAPAKFSGKPHALFHTSFCRLSEDIYGMAKGRTRERSDYDGGSCHFSC